MLAKSTVQTEASTSLPKGRAVLLPSECAARLRCDVDHIYDLIEEGQLGAFDIASRNNKTARRCCRIPVEAWRNFLQKRTC